MRVFLSLPMSERTDEEVNNQIKEMTKAVGKYYVEHGSIKDDITVVHNFDCLDPKDYLKEDFIRNESLLYLGNAIMRLGTSDVIVFGENWERARGCRIEFLVAKEYDIPIYFMDGDELRPGEYLGCI